MDKYQDSWKPVVEKLGQIDKKIEELKLQAEYSPDFQEAEGLNEFSRVIKISLEELHQIAQGIPFEAHQLNLILEIADSYEKKIEAKEIPGNHLLQEYRQEKSGKLSFFEAVNCSVNFLHKAICDSL
ncbi:MAG: hypothetical protein G3M70_01915 [Candidatus Nitronauta litoralis]|uniref:Uncharacterized protein n=1 Tax=Candidatus Nitronauta litoralis TaxID=2705533 RepID=A0A7T0FYX4_9BACT|nr:MAG: hypothetical protein G3M70_01915 [Candidatus Nitronauta litoralis]